jgi:hypothetical protein
MHTVLCGFLHCQKIKNDIVGTTLWVRANGTYPSGRIDSGIIYIKKLVGIFIAYTYIYIYIYIYVYTHIYIYIYICMYKYMYINI